MISIGTRVRVKDNLPDVCAYLWGHEGEVESHRDESTTPGNPPDVGERYFERHMVRFDDPLPCSGAGGWAPMERCRLAERHLSIL